MDSCIPQGSYRNNTNVRQESDDLDVASLQRLVRPYSVVHHSFSVFLLFRLIVARGCTPRAKGLFPVNRQGSAAPSANGFRIERSGYRTRVYRKVYSYASGDKEKANGARQTPTQPTFT